MTIQWFPGHMKDTELFLKQALSSVDVVMEILDARLPASSSNPLLDKMCKSVLRIKVLNKKDLAEPNNTQLWLNYFKTASIAGQRCEAIAITGTDSIDTWRAADLAIAKLTQLKELNNQQKSSKSRRLRVMVAGIPNTGKSTIMNTLAGKKIAKTGDVPAITRHQQRTGLKNRIDIYDTPGILWPVLENKNGAYRLAASGAISDIAIDYNDIALFILKYLLAKYPDVLTKRYKISDTLDSPDILNQSNILTPPNILHSPDTSLDQNEILDIKNTLEENNCLAILKKIGASRGCLKQGGVVDLQKASEILIRELRAGKLGRISLESPEDLL